MTHETWSRFIVADTVSNPNLYYVPHLTGFIDERHGVCKPQFIDCLSNSLFRLTKKKASKLRTTYGRIHQPKKLLQIYRYTLNQKGNMIITFFKFG